AVGLFGLAAAAHQGWSANIFTTASDMFPRRAVGSVVGVGGMAGAMGGATMAVATGTILDRTGGNYMLIFFAVGPAYLVALAVMHLLVPKLRPVDEAELRRPKTFSLGALIGFGFVGLVLGSFMGWCVGLLAQQPGREWLQGIKQGEALLIYMAAGALAGIIIGILTGNLFSKRREQPVQG
ncbi:MAG TPA: hypothetical protein VKA60_23935, partial [Blastocatellia bacterium]|nr:hypothetical protein [Blastocatellia bacterium]